VRYALLQPAWLQDNQRSQSIAAAAADGLSNLGRDWIDTASPETAIKNADCIVVWGLGHPKGQDLLRNAGSVRVMGFDLGYWKRNTKYRVSFDGAHPQKFVMAKKRPMDRFLDDNIKLRQDGNPAGPIVLVGMGRKSADTYGERPGEWETKAVAGIRNVWPDKKIVFRPKAGGGDHVPRGIDSIQTSGLIEDVIRGAAAVVCRHSNVGVDAVIAGVPAAASDGAAASVLKPLGSSPPEMLPQETRVEFLSNLAWFQWSPMELRKAETWLVLEDLARSWTA